MTLSLVIPPFLTQEPCTRLASLTLQTSADFSVVKLSMSSSSLRSPPVCSLPALMRTMATSRLININTYIPSYFHSTVLINNNNVAPLLRPLTHKLVSVGDEIVCSADEHRTLAFCKDHLFFHIHTSSTRYPHHLHPHQKFDMLSQHTAITPRVSRLQSK